MPPSYRCSLCGIDYPYVTNYKACVKCGGDCSNISGGSPMTLKEATSLVNHIKFERGYDAREADRNRRGEVTPEQLGEFEARELAAKWREVEQALDGEG